MATGTIKRLARDKGFGFIRDSSGQEYFFHRSSVEGSFDSLSEGQSVSLTKNSRPRDRGRPTSDRSRFAHPGAFGAPRRRLLEGGGDVRLYRLALGVSVVSFRCPSRM